MTSLPARIASVATALILSAVVSGCTFGLSDEPSETPVVSGGPAVSAAPESSAPDDPVSSGVPSDSPSDSPSGTPSDAPSDAEPVSLTGTCDGSSMLVTAAGSTYLMSGDCGAVQILADDVMFQSDGATSVTIIADGATVIIGQIDGLSVSGSENQVQWDEGVATSAVQVSGDGNTLLGP